MTHTDLTLRIRDIIRNITDAEFTAPIRVRDLQPEGYVVEFEARQYVPVTYGAALPDDKFLEFIEGELRRAGFLRVEYGKAVRNTGLDRPLNKLKSPYDTARAYDKD